MAVARLSLDAELEIRRQRLIEIGCADPGRAGPVAATCPCGVEYLRDAGQDKCRACLQAAKQERCEQRAERMNAWLNRQPIAPAGIAQTGPRVFAIVPTKPHYPDHLAVSA